jgi:hypothetical protein
LPTKNDNKKNNNISRAIIHEVGIVHFHFEKKNCNFFSEGFIHTISKTLDNKEFQRIIRIRGDVKKGVFINHIRTGRANQVRIIYLPRQELESGLLYQTGWLMLLMSST